jgi:hypothetical protein
MIRGVFDSNETRPSLALEVPEMSPAGSPNRSQQIIAARYARPEYR